MRDVPVRTLLLCCGLLGSVSAWAQEASAQAGPADRAPAQAREPDGAQTPEAEAEAGDPHGRTPGGVFSRRIDHAAQWATALELSGEVDALLGPDGLPRTLGDAEVRAGLRGVATRCDLLSHSLSDPSALRRLYETQARVHSALVQDAAAHGESVEVARGLGQLRAAARRLDALDHKDAAAAGAYWQMLADLIDANRTIDDPADRRVFVRELLSRFVEDFGEAEAEEEALDAEVAEYVLDARVSLARLLDEAGEQRAAMAALGPLAEAGPRDARFGEVRTVIQRARALGERIELELPLADGGRWAMADHAGQPLLLHYYDEGYGDTDESFAALRDAIEREGLRGFTIVSLYAGGLTQQSRTPPWPVAVVGLREYKALAGYGLTSVPMYVWVDADGRVAAIGKTLDILRQFPAPAPGSEDRELDAPEIETPGRAAPEGDAAGDDAP